MDYRLFVLELCVHHTSSNLIIRRRHVGKNLERFSRKKFPWNTNSSLQSCHSLNIFKKTKKCNKQECIPVGCVTSAAVAVSLAMHTPRHAHPYAMHAPCNACPPPCMPPCHTCPLPCMSPCHAHPDMNRITDTCENITLPQLHCGR